MSSAQARAIDARSIIGSNVSTPRARSHSGLKSSQKRTNSGEASPSTGGSTSCTRLQRDMIWV